MRRTIETFIALILLLFSVSCSTTGGRMALPEADTASPETGECTLPSSLEITAIDMGQGDATLVASPESLLLVDCGETSWNSHKGADKVDSVIKTKYGENCNIIDYVIITHMHLDHVGYVGNGGIWDLVNNKGYVIREKTLLRDYEDNVGTADGTYEKWRAYLESPDGSSRLEPVTASLGSSQVDMGYVGQEKVDVRIVAVDGRTASQPDGARPEILGDRRKDKYPPSENDYSLGFVLSVGDFQMFFGGDMDGEDQRGPSSAYHDVESFVAPDVGDVEILRVNHHGSSHSTNHRFLQFLRPEVSIMSVGDSNTYGHPSQKVLNRLREARSDVYLTERGDTNRDIGSATVAGDVEIVVSPDGSSFTIEDKQYFSAPP